MPEGSGSGAGRLRMLAVHAHPDDESSKGGATMARYVREGVEVLVATCTGGERGSILNPRLADQEAALLADLPEVRRREMAAAAAVLGVRQTWLGFVDSGFPEAGEDGVVPPLPEGCFGALPVEEAAAPLVALIRSFRPHVVTTYDENGGYPHPDHVMCHRASMEAFVAAADPARYPEAGAPWQAAKLYYDLGFTKAKFLALHEGALAAGLESPFQEWLDRWEDRPADPRRMTTQIACADFFSLRDDALRAHATQIDPDGPFFRAPLEVQRTAWPTEDFELARSFVAPTFPEDDLFAGLRPDGDGVVLGAEVAVAEIPFGEKVHA